MTYLLAGIFAAVGKGKHLWLDYAHLETKRIEIVMLLKDDLV